MIWEVRLGVALCRGADWRAFACGLRQKSKSSIKKGEKNNKQQNERKKVASTKKGSKKNVVKKKGAKKKKDEPSPAILHAHESLTTDNEFEITRSRLLTLDMPLP